MKPQTLHAHEDRLLDFAYGELPAAEARAMEAHLEGCARCTQALDDIRGVRATMSPLALEPAPDAGLDSLLAYAQQAARHASEGPASPPSRWRRWLMPALGLAAVSFFGIVSHQVATSVDLQPSFSQLAKKEAEQARDAEAPAAEVAPPPAPELPKPAPALAEAPQAYAAPPPPAAPPPAARAAEERREQASVTRRKSLRLDKEAAVRGARADWGNATSGAGSYERKRGYDEDTLSDAAGPLAPPAQAQAPMAQAPMAQASMEPQQERSSLRLGGTSRRIGTSGGAPQALESEAMASQPRREVARAAPSAAPAPAKVAVGSTASDDADPFGELFGAGSKSIAKKKGAPSSGTSAAATLSQRALEAWRAGDRAQEARLLRKALEMASSGRERVGLLMRLCDAEFALGQRDAATEACTRVLSEDPGSGAAELARRRLLREAPATKAGPLPAEAPAN